MLKIVCLIITPEDKNLPKAEFHLNWFISKFYLITDFSFIKDNISAL